MLCNKDALLSHALYYENLTIDYKKYFFKQCPQIQIDDIIDKMEIYFCDNVDDASRFMNEDGIKICSIHSIVELPWLIRIVFDKEKLFPNMALLQHIKTTICNNFKNKNKNKTISQMNIMCSVNNNKPIIHIRLEITQVSFNTLMQFVNTFIRELDLNH